MVMIPQTLAIMKMMIHIPTGCVYFGPFLHILTAMWKPKLTHPAHTCQTELQRFLTPIPEFPVEMSCMIPLVAPGVHVVYGKLGDHICHYKG